MLLLLCKEAPRGAVVAVVVLDGRDDLQPLLVGERQPAEGEEKKRGNDLHSPQSKNKNEGQKRIKWKLNKKEMGWSTAEMK